MTAAHDLAAAIPRRSGLRRARSTHRLARRSRPEVELDVADMRCANCADRIERLADRARGRRARAAPIRRNIALVLDYDPNRGRPCAAVFDAIEHAGYTPIVRRASKATTPRGAPNDAATQAACASPALAMMQVMMFSLPLYVGDADGMTRVLRVTVPLVRVSSSRRRCVLYSARPFFANACASLQKCVRRRRACDRRARDGRAGCTRDRRRVRRERGRDDRRAR